MENQSKKVTLFTPVKLGKFELAHRIVLPPLTRMRTVNGFIPNDWMVEYYSQRATKGGFLVTEGTVINETGHGYYGAPGIYTDEQVAGWKKVTAAVHEKGGIIFNQLFHVGRQSHRSLQPNGAEPIGASAIPHEDLVFTQQGWVPAEPNRALETAEVKALVKDYHQAALRAMEAGFDGVELHGANGYLIDQFLQDGTNHRTDAYGGSMENRVRLMIEVLEAMVDVWGSDAVGIRLGPSGTFNSMSDSDPIALFGYAAERLNELDLAYLHLIEPRINGNIEIADGLEPVASMHLRGIFKNKMIAAGGFDQAKAEDILEKGYADMVAFGRHFIANPDLVFRFKNGIPLASYDRETFYGGNEKGYTDYAFYEAYADA
ncbi:alkene reductase [Mucilaginibacter sp. KACC 22773]|uniref:alkene reductase n=1 Tax=Mucilaginibacter sp. KACC 22773 TaxID=3025671 RepID=UPI0023673855|nr:alkene reductase [Mucilaginibacter sp. KACC 22773]WDF79014.1 alkene reductase [Mucilaginibacter sp. KACC 22773]